MPSRSRSGKRRSGSPPRPGRGARLRALRTRGDPRFQAVERPFLARGEGAGGAAGRQPVRGRIGPREGKRLPETKNGKNEKSASKKEVIKAYGSYHRRVAFQGKDHRKVSQRKVQGRRFRGAYPRFARAYAGRGRQEQFRAQVRQFGGQGGHHQAPCRGDEKAGKVYLATDPDPRGRG